MSTFLLAGALPPSLRTRGAAAPLTACTAGHETTANSMTWLLWELARHPEFQALIRAEVRAVRARATERGDAEFTVADLDSMAHCLAAMKEVLRLHPIVYQLSRVTGRDDVLPLGRPLTTVDGTVVNEIAVPKGTNLLISIWTYNRCVSAGLLVEVRGRRADHRATGCRRSGAPTRTSSTRAALWSTRRWAAPTSASRPTS